MQHAATAYKSSNRASLADAGIDWEPLPSLAHLVARTKPHRGDDEPVWSQTMPVDFDTLAPSDPFIEALPGVMLREVNEPDILRLFFESEREDSGR